MKNKLSQDLVLNAVLGFLSLLFIVLLIAFTTRIVFPRIETDRSAPDDFLIGEVIQVEVLNGCGVPGIATRFTSKLRQNGFDVVESGNFETFDMQKTLIIDRIGNLDHAKKIASALGVDESHIIQEISKNYFLDATIVIGSDYKNLNLN